MKKENMLGGSPDAAKADIGKIKEMTETDPTRYLKPKMVKDRNEFMSDSELKPERSAAATTGISRKGKTLKNTSMPW